LFVTIGSLDAGTNFTFVVQARNIKGYSDESYPLLMTTSVKPVAAETSPGVLIGLVVLIVLLVVALVITVIVILRRRRQVKLVEVPVEVPINKNTSTPFDESAEKVDTSVIPLRKTIVNDLEE
jgi:hypothetical protein